MALLPPVTADDHIQGHPNALFEIVEYGDYQCPYCGRAYPIVKKLQEQLGDKMKFIFRNFPLEKIHPLAKTAAVMTEAAALQGKYWEMHDLIFENQKRINVDLTKYAEQLGIDNNQFRRDLLDTKLEKKVTDHFISGMRSGVNATPTFFINGEKYTGAWEGDSLLKHFQQIT